MLAGSTANYVLEHSERSARCKISRGDLGDQERCIDEFRQRNLVRAHATIRSFCATTARGRQSHLLAVLMQQHALLAAANMIVLNRLSVFENYDLNPAGISGNDFPESIALTLTTKLTDKTITRLRVSMRGQIVANVNTPTNLTPFNNAVVEICGGIVNLSLDATTRENLKQNVGSAPQFIEMSVDYTFSDESTANDRLAFRCQQQCFHFV